MKLEEYLFKKKITREAFAEQIGISRGHLQHILGGTKRPSIKLAKRIEQETAGKVTKEELLFPEEFPEDNDL